jgi:hypothetical protein
MAALPRKWVKPEVDPRVPGMGMNKSGKKMK